MKHMSDGGQIGEVSIIAPAIYARLKRLLKALLLASVAVVALFLLWRYAAHRRFQAVIAEVLRDAPQPTTVPAELNAATYLVAAETAAGNLLFSKAEEFARTARRQPYLQWDPMNSTRGPNHSLPALREHLAKLIHELHRSESDSEVMETLLDLIAATGNRGVADSGGLDLESSIVETMDVVNDSIYRIAPTIKVLQGTATTRSTSAASSAQVRAVIDALLDDASFHRPFAQRLLATKVFIAENIGRPGYPIALSNAPLGPFAQPLGELEFTRLLKRLDVWSATIEGSGRPPPLEHFEYPAAADQTWFTRAAFGDQRDALHYIAQHYTALAERRVAAMLLAMRLYQLDHQGQVPPQLEALLPRYLPSLPADPFARDGASFQYTTAPRPSLKSVGFNGSDDGRFAEQIAAAMRTNMTINNRLRWNGPDAVYVLPLNAAPTPTPDN